jgi:predicted nucleic acid-binding protein
MILCIDANVVVAAGTDGEIHHRDSSAMLVRADRAGVQVISPTLLLSEVAAATVRSTGDNAAARRTLDMIRQRPGLSLIPLDATRAQRAAELAITLRLRGADSVYAQVAEEFDAVLVTWDEELLQRTGAAVSAMTPA